jgi:hypothetical protein
MRSFISFLKGVLTAVGQALNGAFNIFGFLLAALSTACFRQPTVPAASDNGEFAEISNATVEVTREEEASIVRTWAAARLNGHNFNMPAGRLAGWLGSLDAGYAQRIASADQSGLLIPHLAGAKLFPKLPPVGSAEATRRWIALQQPEPGRKARAEREPVDYRNVEIAAAHDVEHPPGAYPRY